MEKFKCVIVDDEFHAREIIALLLGKFHLNFQVTGKFDTADNAKKHLSNHQVDLLFLDVNLGDHTGFDLLQKYRGVNKLPVVIFVTGYAEYAIDALKSGAIDYLLKPVDQDQIERAVTRACLRIEEIKFHENLQRRYHSASAKLTILSIPISSGIEFVKVNDIIYLQADRNYTIFHLKKGKSILASKPLIYFENQLESELFYRTHRSFVVQLSDVLALRNSDGGYLILTENHQVSISAKRKKLLIEKLASR